MHSHQLIAAAVLLLALAAVLITLRLRDHDAHSQIRLDDLLIGEDGKVSKAAAVMMGAFLMTTWVIVYLTLRERLTEGYFMAYLGAWVAPTVAKLIKGTGQAPAP